MENKNQPNLKKEVMDADQEKNTDTTAKKIADTSEKPKDEKKDEQIQDSSPTKKETPILKKESEQLKPEVTKTETVESSSTVEPTEEISKKTPEEKPAEVVAQEVKSEDEKETTEEEVAEPDDKNTIGDSKKPEQSKSEVKENVTVGSSSTAEPPEEISEIIAEEKPTEAITQEVKSEDKKEAKVEDVDAETDVKNAIEDSEVKESDAAKLDEIQKEEKKSETSDLESEESDNDEDEDVEDEDDENIVSYEGMSREELVNNLEELINEGDINIIRKKVALIKVAFLNQNKEAQEKQFELFLADGGEETDFVKEKDDIEKKYNDLFAEYRRKRKIWLEEQEQIKQKNLETKKLILEELKTLIESEESLKTTYDEFKNLQDKWKEVGMVPKGEVNNLWQNYHFLVEKFFDKVKINKELRDLDMKKNLELKLELCEKAEELLIETSILKSFKALQDLHKQWKDIGPVPQDKRDELWERFKTTTDKINQRRRDHYVKLKDDQKGNLIAKTALCEKAEEVLQLENESIRDWQENTDKISELLKVWKSIGPAPRPENDKIWERFRTSLDTFFSGKKEYFQKIKDEQLNNYNLKLDICIQAESLKDSDDWKKTTNDLINLQKDWKKIGPVPRKHSDKIWKRFRAACDEFFNRKSDFFGNIKQNEAENLKKKEETIKKIEAFEFGDDKSKNLEILKTLQREWTEIGHVPFKEKDRVQIEYRNAINKQLDKLKINKSEISTMNYKEKIGEMTKHNPNANRIISNEKRFLVNKRNKLQEDVQLWENNMGFLADSKKASLLKEEFEKKIEKVKQEIDNLNEKIRFLERDQN